MTSLPPARDPSGRFFRTLGDQADRAGSTRPYCESHAARVVGRTRTPLDHAIVMPLLNSTATGSRLTEMRVRLTTRWPYPHQHTTLVPTTADLSKSRAIANRGQPLNKIANSQETRVHVSESACTGRSNISPRTLAHLLHHHNSRRENLQVLPAPIKSSQNHTFIFSRNTGRSQLC